MKKIRLKILEFRLDFCSGHTYTFLPCTDKGMPIFALLSNCAILEKVTFLSKVTFLINGSIKYFCITIWKHSLILVQLFQFFIYILSKFRTCYFCYRLTKIFTFILKLLEYKYEIKFIIIMINVNLVRIKPIPKHYAQFLL